MDAQYNLGLPHHEQPEEVHTVVVRRALEYRPGVNQYACEHDYRTKLKYLGRAQGTTFQEFVSPYKFMMYVMREADGQFPTLWVRTKGTVATDFVDRLNQYMREEFYALEKRLDFDLLRPHVQVIKGAWFGEMRAANLSSTAVYGTRVDRSAEFQRAERQGRLHSLTILHNYDGVDYLLMVTVTGGIVTYDSFDTEEHELDVVLDFKQRCLDRCWTM